VREIARRLERAPSTISRELRRNAATRSGGLSMRARFEPPAAAAMPAVAVTLPSLSAYDALCTVMPGGVA
jgi:hypothetical protein